VSVINKDESDNTNVSSSDDFANENKQKYTRLQRLMIGHGILILFMALVAGVGLWMDLLGGFEFIPGTVTHFSVPGTPDGWAKAHRGTPMNALMVIVIAIVLSHLVLSKKAASYFGWIIVGAGWANTIFYFFANYSHNRGLSFGANHFGSGNIMSFIALFPAYVFGVLSMVALIYVACKVFKNEPKETNQNINASRGL
jgi:styrene-oxide isomerase